MSNSITINVVESPLVDSITPCIANSLRSTKVLIKGSNFLSTSSVKFGDYELSSNEYNISWSLDQISILIPASDNDTLLNLNQEIFISNNGKDWTGSGLYLQYLELNDNSKFYEIYNTTELDVLTEYQLYFTDDSYTSISQTNE